MLCQTKEKKANDHEVGKELRKGAVELFLFASLSLMYITDCSTKGLLQVVQVVILLLSVLLE